ncbi:CBS domain protein [Neolewinella xylanilytica]|uniref:CBS domain protein n=1 Tax=Neolewinella xylanilytica TaxID=1514080 RepID=A0A2S6I9P1_9BACT|nr:CBS domain-containing protein [Neolewinella xylanilytica]PPK88213.1 CBS domain protein [Neolewinella xylanilytica]
MNPLLPVRRLMATDLITVAPTTPLGEASALFGQHQIHHLLVVEGGRLVGLLSTSDYLRLLDKSSTATTVADLMSSKLVKLEPDDTVRTAANLFRMNRFHALPVMGKSGEAIGIVTTHDLVRLLDDEEIELKDYRTR